MFFICEECRPFFLLTAVWMNDGGIEPNENRKLNCGIAAKRMYFIYVIHTQTFSLLRSWANRDNEIQFSARALSLSPSEVWDAFIQLKLNW